MKTVDLKFLEMCEEIDTWKNEAKYWKDKFDVLDEQQRKDLYERIENSSKRTTQLVKLAMCADPEKLEKAFGGE